MSTLPSADDTAIEAERAKAAFVYTEEISPGLKMEMELRQMMVTTSSDFQKIDVIETYFGKVSECL